MSIKILQGRNEARCKSGEEAGDEGRETSLSAEDGGESGEGGGDRGGCAGWTMIHNDAHC